MNNNQQPALDGNDLANRHIIQTHIWREIPDTYTGDKVLSMMVDGQAFAGITEREGESIRNWLNSIGIKIKATSKASIIRRLRDFNLALEFMEQTWLDDTHIIREYVIKPLLPFERKVEICNEVIKASGLIIDICSNPSKPDLEMIKSIRDVCETIQQLTDKLDAFSKDKYTQHKAHLPPLNPRAPLPFKQGDNVLHHKFGQGIVIASHRNADDYEVTVRFKNTGIKKLLASLANLEKLTPELEYLANIPF